MTDPNRQIPSYSRVGLWIKEYGTGGSDDMRSIRDYLEIEANEAISSLRAELHSISKGNYTEDIMHKIIGQGRKVKHGSYDEWARLMLRWMSTT